MSNVARYFCVLAAILAASCKDNTLRDCSLSRANWRDPSNGIPELAAVNRITVTRDGQFHWNGALVNEKILYSIIERASKERPIPFVILRSEMGANCQDVSNIREQMEKFLPCTSGGCGEGDQWDALR